MSDQDINRFKVIQDVCERRLKRADAAAYLNLSVRQVQRLMTRLREYGAAGLIHLSRGKPSNHRYPPELRAKILTIIRERYADFSPTLAREKLIELHDIHISKETLRQWMIAEQLMSTLNRWHFIAIDV